MTLENITDALEISKISSLHTKQKPVFGCFCFNFSHFTLCLFVWGMNGTNVRVTKWNKLEILK